MDIVKHDDKKMFSIFGIDDTGVILKREVSVDELENIIFNRKPDVVALESVYEIGDKESILKFAKSLPSGIDLVQIIDDPDKHKKLLKSAVRNDIEVKNYKKASEKARITALLVKNGIGKKVNLTEGTEIRVSKGSDNLNGEEESGIVNLIRKKINEIKFKLEKNNLEYIFEEKETNNSIIGVFSVFESYQKVRPSITEIDSNITVTMRPVKDGNIRFTSLKTGERLKRNIIVGIDPGMTSGIGILDMKGNILQVNSLKDFSVTDLVNLISELGEPAIIATDVKPVPNKVEKISRVFDSKLYVPDESLPIKKKKELIEDHEIEVEDDHQMDALAAAKNAYNAHRSKFSNIEAKLTDELKEKSGKIKSMVLKGTTIEKSIEKAEKSNNRM